MPIRIGPTSSPPATTLMMLRTPLAASVLAKTSTFAGPSKRAFGKMRARSSGSSAASECISPSYSKSSFWPSRIASAAARPPAGAGVEVAELRVRAERDLRHQPEAPHVPRRGDHHVGDLLRRRLGMDLGVGDEDDPPLVDHQRQRPDRAQPLRAAAQHLADVVQVPEILPEGAADQAVGLAAMHHHRADRRGVGAHDRPREIRGDARAAA